jgi:hypothetical protein
LLLPPASECLVAASDTTHRLGTSPTCVSAMPLCDGTDVRTVLQDGCIAHSKLATMPVLEVPAWCGRISIGATIKDPSSLRLHRETIDARILISTSSADHFHPAQVLQGRFTCERFNAAAPLSPSARGIPVTSTKDVCWGKILPARQADLPALLKLGSCLSQFDHVAVPPAYRQHHSYYLMQQHLDVRIVTKQQALRLPCLLPDWLLDSSKDGTADTELLCYWCPSERSEELAPTHREDLGFPSLLPLLQPQQSLVASS